MISVEEYKILFTPRTSTNSLLSSNMHPHIQQLVKLVALATISILATPLFTILPQRAQRIVAGVAIVSSIAYQYLAQYQSTNNTGIELQRVTSHCDEFWSYSPDNEIDPEELSPAKRECIFGVLRHDISHKQNVISSFFTEYLALSLNVCPIKRQYTFDDNQTKTLDSSLDRVMIYRNIFTQQYNALFLLEAPFKEEIPTLINRCGWPSHLSSTQALDNRNKTPKQFVPKIASKDGQNALQVVNQDGTAFELKNHHITTLLSRLEES